MPAVALWRPQVRSPEGGILSFVRDRAGEYVVHEQTYRMCECFCQPFGAPHLVMYSAHMLDIFYCIPMRSALGVENSVEWMRAGHDISCIWMPSRR